MTDLYNLAADAPDAVTYDSLKALYKAGKLGGYLLSLTAKQRIGCAAINALRTGRDLTPILARFDAEIAAAKAAAEAEALTVAALLDLEREAGTTDAPYVPSLPPVGTLLDALARLSAASPDAAYQRAAGRAGAALIEGAAIAFDADGDLVAASHSEAGRLHRANQHGCTCRARGTCWHTALWDAVVMVMDEEE